MWLYNPVNKHSVRTHTYELTKHDSEFPPHFLLILPEARLNGQGFFLKVT